MPIKIHPRFKLNGISFSNEELKEVGYSLVKEGKPFEQIIGNFLLDWLNMESIISVETSGSTGKPKRIDLKKEHMVNSALATGSFFDLKTGDKVLLCLSADFIAGKMMLVRAMVLGLELDYLESSSKPLEGIFKTYDFCAMVPLQLENSLNQIHRIKKLIIGGAPMSPALKEKIQNKKIDFFETYGMTETITHIAAKKIAARSNTIKRFTASPMNSSECCFKTLPGVTVSTDKRDCLVITASNIIIEPVVTNDVVHLISETEFEWLGRYDNVINSGGIKWVPEQIEAKLTTIIDNRFFITGIPDEKLGKKLVLIIEGKTDENQLLEKIKTIKTLGKFEIPKEVLSVPEFVKTKNGKTLRKETLKYLS